MMKFQCQRPIDRAETLRVLHSERRAHRHAADSLRKRTDQDCLEEISDLTSLVREIEAGRSLFTAMILLGFASSEIETGVENI